jgi:hypothetical protein
MRRAVRYPKVSFVLPLLLSAGLVSPWVSAGDARAVPATAIVDFDPGLGAPPPVDPPPLGPPPADPFPATATPSLTEPPALLVPIVPVPERGSEIIPPPVEEPPVGPPAVIEKPGVADPISSDPGAVHPTSPADAAPASPLIQGPEQFGLPNGCLQGQTQVEVGKACLGGSFDVSECISSQSTCELSNRSAKCVAHNIFKPLGTVCRVATGQCARHSRCDGAGICADFSPISCSGYSKDGCTEYVCPEPGEEKCAEKPVPPIDCVMR